MIHVVENFLKDPISERDRALAATYSPICHNGLNYQGIAMTTDEASENKLRLLCGTNGGVFETFWRRYLADEESETFIHNDIEIGHHSAILFLNSPEQCKGGVAFWRHKLYGWHRQPTAQELEVRGLEDTKEFWQSLYQDGFHEKKWEMVEYVPMAFNRLVLFDSNLFHSRYPKRAFGTDIHSARLIKTFFFMRPDRAIKAF